MGLFSVIYICTALALYQFQIGDAALVYANVVNLFARILYALRFVTIYFKSHNCGDLIKWSVVRPRWQLLAFVGLSVMLITYNDRSFNVSQFVKENGSMAILSPLVVLHVSLGVFLAIVYMFMWWILSSNRMPEMKKD